MPWIAIVPVETIQPGQMRDYELIDGTMLGIAHLAEGIVAFDARCPHQGGPLTNGRLIGDLVRCPWHNYCFHLVDGRCIEPSGALRLRHFAVRVEAGMIEVELPLSEGISPP